MRTKYVINVVNLIGDKTRIFEMLEEIKRDELGVGSVDFNKVIPIPVDGSVSDHWCLDNWGTCQNTVTYMDFDVYEPVEIAENIIEIAFGARTLRVRVTTIKESTKKADAPEMYEVISD